MHTIPWLLAGLVAGFLISLVWKQSTPRLTVNPSGRMQLWKASVLTLYSTDVNAPSVILVAVSDPGPEPPVGPLPPKKLSE